MSSNVPVVSFVTETVEPIKHVKSKNKLKGGASIENDDNFLDEFFHNNNH